MDLNTLMGRCYHHERACIEEALALQGKHLGLRAGCCWREYADRTTESPYVPFSFELEFAELTGAAVPYHDARAAAAAAATLGYTGPFYGAGSSSITTTLDAGSQNADDADLAQAYATNSGSSAYGTNPTQVYDASFSSAHDAGSSNSYGTSSGNVQNTGLHTTQDATSGNAQDVGLRNTPAAGSGSAYTVSDSSDTYHAAPSNTQHGRSGNNNHVVSFLNMRNMTSGNTHVSGSGD